MLAELLKTIDAPAPLSALSPKTAMEIAAGLTPSARRKLRNWVAEALQSHQTKGRSTEARFCVVMLNALNSYS